MSNILLTGGAGFIGSHLAEALLSSGDNRIICIDNFDPFYPTAIKEQNLAGILQNPRFRLIRADIARHTAEELHKLCGPAPIDIIVHLAAKAGVRPSIAQPGDYYDTNVKGTLQLLELARQQGIPRFVFSSSSSVYGVNPRVPWREADTDLQPISPYASSKLAAEGLGKVYAHLYGIRFTALRLFTVYGPRQRPDLAIHKFYNLMKNRREITLFGDGSTSRDYTYVKDIVKGIMAAMQHTGEKFSVFNLGSQRPVTLLQMVQALERVMQAPAVIRYMEEQPGDVKQTYADITRAQEQLGYKPSVSLE